MKTSIKIVIILLLSCNIAKAQVGVNTLNPDTTAILHVYSTTKGILLPSLADSVRQNMISPAEGLLVYDEVEKVYFFYNRSNQTWMALNPFQVDYNNEQNVVRGDVHLSPSFKDRNVVIGGVNKTEAKLHVGGNIKAEDTIHAKTVHTSGNIKAGDKLEVTNAVTAKSVTTSSDITTENGEFIGHGIVPLNAIMMYKGPMSRFDPTTGKGLETTSMRGWAICDGRNNTPDLSGRFIVGYDPRDDDYKVPGPGGGLKKVELTIEQMPRHSHEYSKFDEAYIVWGGNSLQHAGNNYTTNTGETGGNSAKGYGNAEAHENRPPYYVLVYIMRIE